MSKKLSRKLCAHCGKPCSNKTKDHVIPRGLWEKKRRPKVMITVPACEKCNNTFSEDERYFRTVLLAMLPDGPRHPEAEILWNGAVRRSFENGWISTDIFGRLSRQPRFTDSGLFVNWGNAFQLDIARFEKVIAKIVKGIFYYKSQRPLPKTHVVHVYRGNNFWSDGHFNAMFGDAPFQGLGDDVFLGRFVRDNEDHDSTAHTLTFYQAIGVFAVTIPRKRAQPGFGGIVST